MSEPKAPDELGLEAALDVLEAPLAELEARLLAGDDVAAALRRQQLEALALLAWVLPAEPVAAASRQRLLGRLQGDETVRVARPAFAGEGAASPAAPPAPGPHGVLDPPAEPTPVTAPAAAGQRKGAPAAAAAAAGPRGGAPRGGGAAAGQRRGALPPAAVSRGAAARSYRWALPLAAVLALAVAGVAFHDWRLGRELARTRQQLAAVESERQQLASRLDAGGATPAEAAALHGKTRELESQLAMVTSPGSLVCALRPSPGAPARDAAGVLYVADDHQHWYLRARKLPPPGDGRAYQLWFLVGDEPVHAGTFTLAGDEAVMSSPTMPKGTTAALVTVEPAGGPRARPSGAVVLYGRDMKPLL